MGQQTVIPAPATPNQIKNLISGKEPKTEFVMSPSQIDKFLSCERAAGLEYGDGFWEESQVPDGCITSAQLGDLIHNALEAYVKRGTLPDRLASVEVGGYFNGRPWTRKVYPGQIADAAICLIPPGAVAESELRLTRPNGITWTGRRDLRIAPPGNGCAEVRDYKTTSDFKYIEEKNLATDVQGTVYAWAECEEHPETDVVHLHWQFLRTKGRPESKSLRLDVTRAEAYERMSALDVVAERWIGLRKKIALGVLRGADLEPTGIHTGACDKFMGCPHRGTRCILTAEQTLKALGRDTNVTSIQDRLNAMTQRQTAMGSVPAPTGMVPAPASVPAPIAAPAPSVRPAFWLPGDPMNPAQEYFKGQGKPLSVIASAADAPPPPDVAATYDKAAQAPVESGHINGPAPGNPPLAAINPAAAAAFVNAPTVPAPAPATPAPVGGDRDALKAEAVRRGLVGTGSRLGAAALQKLLETGTAEVPVIREAVPAPHTPETFAAQKAEFEALYPGAVNAVPAPAGAQFDDAFLDAIADRVVERLKAAFRAL